MQRSFVVLVPVKPPAAGKSRLVGLSDSGRRRLAMAFALDTTAAALSSRHVERVLVTTDDAHFARDLSARGCDAMPDGDTTGLNGALRQASAEAQRRWPDLAPVALLADLPALETSDLDAALEALEPNRACFVADAAGTGTTLYSAPREDFDPRFGVESAAAHLDAAALALTGELATLRRDVDDLADLREAERLGLGVETRRVLAELDVAEPT